MVCTHFSGIPSSYTLYSNVTKGYNRINATSNIGCREYTMYVIFQSLSDEVPCFKLNFPLNFDSHLR